MRRAEAILIAVMALALGGCVLRGKPQVAKAAPAPPTPVVPAPPPPPPEPLSIPQTNVQLPAAQPISPEAMNTMRTAEEPTPAPAPARGKTGRNPSSGNAAAPPKPEPGPQLPAATPPVAEPTRPPLQDAVSPGELRGLQERAAASKQEIRQRISQAQGRRLTRQQRGALDRIQTFVKQSDDAERRGDMRQANELAGRALVLARELPQ